MCVYYIQRIQLRLNKKETVCHYYANRLLKLYGAAQHLFKYFRHSPYKLTACIKRTSFSNIILLVEISISCPTFLAFFYCKQIVFEALTSNAMSIIVILASAQTE